MTTQLRSRQSGSLDRAGRSRGPKAREAKAVAYLERCESASALDLGTAAVAGEKPAKNMSRGAKASIGLRIAVSLANRGIVRATRENRFVIDQPARN